MWFSKPFHGTHGNVSFDATTSKGSELTLNPRERMTVCQAHLVHCLLIVATDPNHYPTLPEQPLEWKFTTFVPCV